MCPRTDIGSVNHVHALPPDTFGGSVMYASVEEQGWGHHLVDSVSQEVGGSRSPA